MVGFDEEYYRKLSRIVIRKMINYNALKYANGKDIAIYPFGKIGHIVKDVLNKDFRITERMIIDNKVSMQDDRIRNLKQLTKEEIEECIFLITSDNEDFYEEIRLELKKYVPAAQIFDMFDRVRDNRDTRIETLRLNAERINRLV